MAFTPMLIGGEWAGSLSGRTSEITSPYSGAVVGEVPRADARDVDVAITAAEAAGAKWGRTPAHQRAPVLFRAAEIVENRIDVIATTISGETGKTLAEARIEAGRSAELIRLSTFEGSQLYGESLPLDAQQGTGQDKIGFTIRQPCGVVLAITPFNFPALLVLHKLAPALAAGNAVVLKPAEATPLTALALVRAFLDAGVPPDVVSVITGNGGEIGDQLVGDPRIRKISFTGSTEIGERITRHAGVKKLSLELGASCPLIILRDADLELAASAVAIGGYANAGQICISVQRVITDPAVTGDFLDALVPKVRAIRTGDPSAPETTMGTLINTSEAIRVHRAISVAAETGARVLVGGDRDGATVAPTVVADVDLASPLSQNELFGPAVAVSAAEDWESAVAAANSTAYGLAAGIFTSDVAGAVRAMREIDAGNIHINWTPQYRADLMPYGGLKGSGIGKEGPRRAVAEMTEEKTVVLHGRPW